MGIKKLKKENKEITSNIDDKCIKKHTLNNLKIENKIYC